MDEWRRLPWWQTRLYEEGLVQEFAGENGDDLDRGRVEVVPPEQVGIRWA